MIRIRILAGALVIARIMLVGPAQTTNEGKVLRPNAIIHSVADLDKSVAFYRNVFGLEADPTPRFPSGPVLGLDAFTNTENAHVRSTSLIIPGTDVRLTLVEFSNVNQAPVRLLIQDPGAIKLGLRVRDMKEAVSRLKMRGAEIRTTGGSPVLPEARHKTRAVFDRYNI